MVNFVGLGYKIKTSVSMAGHHLKVKKPLTRDCQKTGPRQLNNYTVEKIKGLIKAKDIQADH